MQFGNLRQHLEKFWSLTGCTRLAIAKSSQLSEHLFRLVHKKLTKIRNKQTTEFPLTC